jgi:2-methylcitrate dehydratase
MDTTADTATAHQRLARMLQGIRYEDIPPEVVKSTKRLILDSLGCVAGGFTSAPGAAVRKAIDRMGGHAQATVIGTKHRTSAPLAALANGTALRYLDFNASYNGHDPSKVSGLLAAALAVAEMENRSGKDLITAMVAGAEMQCRLSDYAGDPSLKDRGFHHTCNLQFGAVVAAGRLLNLDAATLAQAMSISATHLNTLAQIQHGKITMIKASADAWAAKGGVEAALLAACGLTGPDEILEGKAGWTRAVAGKVDYDGLLGPIKPHEFRIAKARIKAFAVVGPGQTVVQSAVDLRAEKKIDPNQIEKIVISLPERVVSDPAVDDDKKRFPKNRETADHSFHYIVAIGLIDGDVGEAQYAPEKLASPLVRRLLENTTLRSDAEFSAKRTGGGGVQITLKDGTVLEKRYMAPPGHPTNPMTDEQVARKYDRQMEPVFPKAQSEAVKQAVFALETCGNVNELGKLLAL